MKKCKCQKATKEDLYTYGVKSKKDTVMYICIHCLRGYIIKQVVSYEVKIIEPKEAK